VTRAEALAVLALRDPHTPTELRLAYRRSAFASHPDRGGDGEVLVRVNLAYEILGGKGDGGGFTIDVESVDPAAGKRRRRQAGPMPRDKDSQARVLFQCERCRTVFVGGGLAVEHCTQVLANGTGVCGGKVTRMPEHWQSVRGWDR
jgi:hypothetical protein